MTGYGPIGGNKEFREGFKNVLVAMALEAGEGRIGESGVRVFLFGYVLYRQVFKEEDRELFKKVWSLQKRVHTLLGPWGMNFYIHELLTRHAPLTKKSDNLDPKTPIPFLQQLFTLQISQLP